MRDLARAGERITSPLESQARAKRGEFCAVHKILAADCARRALGGRGQ
jgi:hypothetical protein